jgi:hypothetical protein
VSILFLVISCHEVPFYVMECQFCFWSDNVVHVIYVIQRHIMSFYVISCNLCHIMSFSVISCNFMSYNVILYLIMSFYVISCNFISYYIISCVIGLFHTAIHYSREGREGQICRPIPSATGLLSG